MKNIPDNCQTKHDHFFGGTLPSDSKTIYLNHCPVEDIDLADTWPACYFVPDVMIDNCMFDASSRDGECGAMVSGVGDL